MSEEILKKIPVETKWAITTQSFIGAYSAIIQLVGPFVGEEKLMELNNTVMGEGSKIAFPQIKEGFNVPVEDAIGGYKVLAAATAIQMGPTFEDEMIEVTPERVVWNTVKCPFWDTAQQFGVKPETMTCPGGHQEVCAAGLKALNPNFTFKLTKAIPKGDSVCQNVIEFKK